MEILKKLAQNKVVQDFIKSKVSTKVWTTIVTVSLALGLTTAPVQNMVQEVSAEQVTSIATEAGGGAIKDLWTPDDSTIITGLVEEDLPSEVVSAGPVYKLPEGAPTWNEVNKKLKDKVYVRERKQKWGTCTYESHDIMTIEALQYQGLDPVKDGVDTFLDINHAYLNKSFQKGRDTGSVPEDVYNEYCKDGFPIRTTVQHEARAKISFEDLKASADSDAYSYRIKCPYKKIDSGYGPDSLMYAIDKYKAEGRNIVYRISKRNYNNVEWYFETTPYIKSPIKDPRGTGHSMAGSGAHGVFEYRGEPTIYIHESTGSVSYHLARKSVLDMVMTSWEIYEPTGVNNGVITSGDPLESQTIRRGQSGPNVVALQTFLMTERKRIPAGATGYFGSQTQTALNQWQDEKFGDIYNGSEWEILSQTLYKAMKAE